MNSQSNNHGSASGYSDLLHLHGDSDIGLEVNVKTEAEDNEQSISASEQEMDTLQVENSLEEDRKMTLGHEDLCVRSSKRRRLEGTGEGVQPCLTSASASGGRGPSVRPRLHSCPYTPGGSAVAASMMSPFSAISDETEPEDHTELERSTAKLFHDRSGVKVWPGIGMDIYPQQEPDVETPGLSGLQRQQQSPHSEEEEVDSGAEEDLDCIMADGGDHSYCIDDIEGHIEEEDLDASGMYNISWMVDYNVELQPLPAMCLKYPRVKPVPKPYTALSVFEAFLTPDIVDCLVWNTNENYRYHCAQKSESPVWWDVTQEELWQYFGELVFLGLVNVQDRRLLYAPNSVGGFLKRSAIKRDRFVHLENNLRLSPVGESCTSSEDYLQPFLELVLRNFQASVEPGEHICIGETFIPFKGKSRYKDHSLRMHHRRGFRAHILACSCTGYVFNLLFYGIQQTMGGPLVDDAPGGNTGKTVATLVELYAGSGRKLYLDGDYGTPALAVYLRNKAKMDTCGTVKKDLHGMPKLFNPDTGRTLVIQGHVTNKDSTLEDQKTKILLLNHRRNQSTTALLLMTTFHGSQAKSVCWNPWRISSTGDTPVAVEEYNCFRRGVHKMVQALEPHSLESTKVDKWYIVVFRRLFGIILYNASVAYNLLLAEDDLPNLSFNKFRILLADEIFAKYGGAVENRLTTKPRHALVAAAALSAVNAEKERRLISIMFAHHLQYMSENKNIRRICVACKLGRRTKTGCKACSVFLCSIECAMVFHQKHRNVTDIIRSIQESHADHDPLSTAPE